MWNRSVRASREEKTRPLPGDDLIEQPIDSITHGLTILRSPRDVWPWLAQMGAGRAGWYSYDRLDNGGHRSAVRILPEYQMVGPGTVFPALPGVRDGFTLVRHERDRYLALGWCLPDGRCLVTWVFVLEPLGAGRTRLLVRARARRGYTFRGLPAWLSPAVVRPIHFVMERKMLRGVARRAESADPLLDRFMPEYEFGDRHRTFVAAPVETTFAAACQLDMQRSPTIRAIFKARELLLGSRPNQASYPAALVAWAKALGWGVLAVNPGREVVFGAVTRAWEADVTFRALRPDAFRSFEEPGYVKIVWTLCADPSGDGSIARTETRVITTDAAARVKFGRYWLAVSPGIRLIRRLAFRMVKREAERHARRWTQPRRHRETA
jgi:hypothetical protein